MGEIHVTMQNRRLTNANAECVIATWQSKNKNKKRVIDKNNADWRLTKINEEWMTDAWQRWTGDPNMAARNRRPTHDWEKKYTTGHGPSQCRMGDGHLSQTDFSLMPSSKTRTLRSRSDRCQSQREAVYYNTRQPNFILSGPLSENAPCTKTRKQLSFHA